MYIDKFDKEHRLKEEELIRKFYNNESSNQNDQEVKETLDSDIKNNDTDSLMELGKIAKMI